MLTLPCDPQNVKEHTLTLTLTPTLTDPNPNAYLLIRVFDPLVPLFGVPACLTLTLTLNLTLTLTLTLTPSLTLSLTLTLTPERVAGMAMYL